MTNSNGPDVCCPIGWAVYFPLLLCLAGGCGADFQAKYAASEASPAADASSEPSPAENSGKGDDPLAAKNAGVRRIIYSADISLVVKDLSALEASLPELVKTHGGYLSSTQEDRTRGRHRTGTWTARVPVAEYDKFLEAVSNLGIPEKRSQTAQDVTEEYVDLEARSANKKRLEARILELLDKSKGAIKDIIEVERELARVREEIERFEGRLRFLKNRTDLTTVTVTAREEQNYVPPKAPSFLTRVTGAWSTSLTAMRRFGENLAIGLVAFAPWLILLILLATPPLWWIRRRWRQA